MYESHAQMGNAKFSLNFHWIALECILFSMQIMGFVECNLQLLLAQKTGLGQISKRFGFLNTEQVTRANAFVHFKDADRRD